MASTSGKKKNNYNKTNRNKNAKNNYSSRNYKMMLNVVAIVLGMGIILGVSYAIFKVTDRGDKENIITTGNFGLEINNESTSGISVTNALPMTEEEGRKTTPYTFTLENTGDYDISYKLGFEATEASNMTTKAIRYIFNPEGKDNSSNLMSSAIEENITDDDNTEKTVYYVETGIIGAGESKSYTLYLWIDYDATTEDASGKVFSIKARADGEAVASTTPKEITSPTSEELANMKKDTDTDNYAVAESEDIKIYYTINSDDETINGILINIGDNNYFIVNKDYTSGNITYKKGLWYNNTNRYFGSCPFQKADLTTIYDEEYLDYIISLFN